MGGDSEPHLSRRWNSNWNWTYHYHRATRPKPSVASAHKLFDAFGALMLGASRTAAASSAHRIEPSPDHESRKAA